MKKEKTLYKFLYTGLKSAHRDFTWEVGKWYKTEGTISKHYLSKRLVIMKKLPEKIATCISIFAQVPNQPDEQDRAINDLIDCVKELQDVLLIHIDQPVASSKEGLDQAVKAAVLSALYEIEIVRQTNFNSPSLKYDISDKINEIRTRYELGEGE